MKKGKFIVFEGLDGSGLTTQAGLLRNHLLDNGEKVLLTKEQTDSLIGGLIKSCLKGEWKTNPLTIQLLFAADRAHHLETEILPALKNGQIVISDRYMFSSLAFGALKVDPEFLKFINSNFRKPDITFILDTPPKICMERIGKSRFHVELFENSGKSELVRKNFLDLKDYFPNTYVIDGNRAREEIHEEILNVVKNKFGF